MTHALPIFRRLELLQLQDIHELQVASFVYDCINGFAPTYFKFFFTLLKTKHQTGTRQAMKGNIFVERRNTDQYGIRSIQFSGVKIWNSIPVKIRSSASRATFRAEMKKYYISLYT